MELLDFTEKTAPLNSFVIPAITVRGKKYLAPASLLRGMTFGQFIFVDTFFRNYGHSKSEDEMAGMLAALFLPENEPFSEENIPARRALMQHVDAATCEAVRFNYVLVFEWLMKVYPLVFPDIENADEKAEKAAAKEKEKKQHDSAGWIKIFESIVGDDIVNQEKYAALPLHTVLRYLTRKLKENMKRKH